MSFRYSGPPTSSGYHYGLGGLGVRGDEIPGYGAAGPSLQYADISLPAEAPDEFRVVLLTTPTLGTLFVYEDSSFDYSGPDGVHVFSYAGYKNGALYGIAAVTLTVGYGLAGALQLDSVLLSGDLIGVDAAANTAGRRIGPRVALRANGELIVLF